VHGVSQRQARTVLAAIAARMEQVGLRLHPGKARIVYCQDGKRRASYEHTEFTYLGFTFRQRGARAKDGRQFNSILPAICKEALKKISAEVQSWRLYNRTGQDLIDVARDVTPIVRGWMQYCGQFDRVGGCLPDLVGNLVVGAGRVPCRGRCSGGRSRRDGVDRPPQGGIPASWRGSPLPGGAGY
jgi:hypothetical protein